MRNVMGSAILVMGLLGAGASQAAGPPLKIIVGFPPGGSMDAMVRVLEPSLSKSLDRPIIVETRTGAGGQIATVAVKNAAPDGNTILAVLDHIGVILPLIMKDPGYDPVKDFEPLGLVVSVPSALAVNPSTGVRNLRDFDAWLKKNKDNVSYGIPAVGSTPQFTGYIVARRSGVKMTPIPYRGAAPLAVDLAGGQILVGTGGLSDLLPLHKDGKLRIIATNGTTRVPAVPEVETYRENGFTELDVRTWYGFFAPKGTPAAFVNGFAAALKSAMDDPAIQKRMVEIGLDPAYGGPADMATALVKGRDTWKPVIEESGYEKQ
jgi:tripartite-type tricarboxylate transporter receptor subunit TctC